MRRSSTRAHNKHWSEVVQECVVSGGPQGRLSFSITGGAENGEFCYVSDIHHSRLVYHSGRLVAGQLILEVQGQRIPGMTLSDLDNHLQQCSKNGAPVILKALNPDILTLNLRQFLSRRFPRESIDHELQQLIRHNLYKRTVPCTTRPCRPGEVNHVDYTFLTTEQFEDLEQSGALLESGEFEGHKYGTPKPPKEAGDAQIAEAFTHKKRARSVSGSEDPDPDTDLGPLPPNWEMAFTDDGTAYFIDHNTQGTHWLDPRTGRSKKINPLECREDELPYGWEKVEDPHYGTYYIDHVNRRTQYENPVEQAKKDKNEILPQEKNQETKEIQETGEKSSRPFFTKSPEELHGEFIKTQLVKSSRGFGFTILGGDNRDEEFLQIKSVVAGGTAASDGKLSPGDVLVYVRAHCVLGYTHQDIVSLFQSILVGEKVTIEVCRGYRLPFDPDTEIITEVAVSLPSPTLPPPSTPLTSLEMLRVEIEKGQMGFGFTIADSSGRQKVRQILDSTRCNGLNEGDVLLEVRGIDVTNISHNDLVQILKDVPQGDVVTLVIQRLPLMMPGSGPPGLVPPGSAPPGSTPSVDHETGSLEGAMFTPSHGDQKQPDLLQRSRTPGPDFLHRQDTEFVDGTIQRIRSKTPTIEVASRSSNFMTPSFIPASAFSSSQGPSHPQSSAHPHSSAYPQSSAHLQSSAYTHSSSHLHGSSHPRMPGPPVHSAKPHVNNSLQLPFGTSKLTEDLAHLPPPYLPHPHMAPPPHAPPHMRRLSTSFEHSVPMSVAPTLHEYMMPPTLQEHMEQTVTLYKRESGFGFRILGGTEEGSQVTVGRLVPDGSAAIDSRLSPGDEILSINSESVVGASHHYVVSLMSRAAVDGHVTLHLRRGAAPAAPSSPPSSPVNASYDVTVTRAPDQGFGFVIISSTTKSGSVIGRILSNSPAERTGQLHVGDRILAVNNQNIMHSHHEEVVTLIKDSGFKVTLTIAADSPNTELRLQTQTHPTPHQVDVNQFQHEPGSYPRHSSAAILNPHQPNWNITPIMPASSSPSDTSDVHLTRGSRGFGFSIRGGQEFNSMPLFVLKVASGGAAEVDGRLQVGDEILEINDRATDHMTHAQAIDLIQNGGTLVRLKVRRETGPASTRGGPHIRAAGPDMLAAGAAAGLSGSAGHTGLLGRDSLTSAPVGQSSPNFLPQNLQQQNLVSFPNNALQGTSNYVQHNALQTRDVSLRYNAPVQTSSVYREPNNQLWRPRTQPH